MKHDLGLWEEAGIPGKIPRRHKEDIQTPHRKVPAGIQTRDFLQSGKTVNQ